jgi:hypothetical protein
MPKAESIDARVNRKDLNGVHACVHIRAKDSADADRSVTQALSEKRFDRFWLAASGDQRSTVSSRRARATLS